MRKGLVSDASAGVLRSRNELVSLIKGKEEHEAIFSEFYTIKSAFEYIDRKITGIPQEDMEKLTSLFEAVLTPNVTFDMDLTETALAEKLDGISPNYGFIARGKHIISKGEPVSEHTYTVLSSLRKAYNMQSSDTQGRLSMTLGYVIVIFIIFISLYGLIKIFKKGKYFHDKPMVLIVFNMLASFVMCYIITRFSPLMIYIVPLCMQTIILRSFFNARIAFMVHLSTVFICSFMAPNIYMYIFVGTDNRYCVRIHVECDIPPLAPFRKRCPHNGAVDISRGRCDAGAELVVHPGDAQRVRIPAHFRSVDAFRPAGDIHLREDVRYGIRYIASGTDGHELPASQTLVAKCAGHFSA